MQEKTFQTKSWIMACFWGWLIGIVLILLLSGMLEALGTEDLQFYVGLGMGAGVGLAQWLWLKRRFPVAPLWILLSALGMCLPFLLMDFMPVPDGSYKLPLSVVLGGLITGRLQSQLLKKETALAAGWMMGSLLAWSLSSVAVLLVNFTMMLKAEGILNLLLAFLNLMLILLGGVVLGFVSGKVLKRILAEPSVAKPS